MAPPSPDWVQGRLAIIVRTHNKVCMRGCAVGVVVVMRDVCGRSLHVELKVLFVSVRIEWPWDRAERKDGWLSNRLWGNWLY